MTNESFMELLLTIEIHDELQRHAKKLADFRLRANSSHLDVILNDSIQFVSDSIEEL